MGTGSRELIVHEDKLNIHNTLQAFILLLRDDLAGLGDELILITGMAEGWDESLAIIGMENNISYIAVIPTKNYGEYYWGKKSLTGFDRNPEFRTLVRGATEIYWLEDVFGPAKMTQRGPTYNGEHANLVRNQVMVDMCDMAVVYNPRSAGTRDAVRRLDKVNKPYMVYPFEHERHT